MTMQNDFDNFDQLRRLLALKRHEQPPPGYFHRFPGQVIARIRAGEHTQELGVLWRWFGEDSWLARFWGRLESQPVLAASVSVAACALIFAGVVLSTENAETGPTPYAPQPTMEASLGLANRSSHSSEIEPVTLAAFEMTNSFGGASARSSLFSAQPVNFITTFGN